LAATPEEILARVIGNGIRPLLNVPDPAARIGQLLAERQAGYSQFKQIQTDGKTADQVAEEIVQCLSTM
jgi:shikimate kinase